MQRPCLGRPAPSEARVSTSPTQYADLIISNIDRTADFLVAVFGWVKG
jgi:hypothetical protein